MRGKHFHSPYGSSSDLAKHGVALCFPHVARIPVLHFNENVGREQATTREGELCFKIATPRSRKGHSTARPKPADATFQYRDELLDELMVCLGKWPTLKEAVAANPPDHLPPMCASYPRPPKSELIVARRTRFASHAGRIGSSDGLDDTGGQDFPVAFAKPLPYPPGELTVIRRAAASLQGRKTEAGGFCRCVDDDGSFKANVDEPNAGRCRPTFVGYYAVPKSAQPMVFTVQRGPTLVQQVPTNCPALRMRATA
ncbi:uncharacterized protein ISCGN_010808 [Ixodes scapularis]